MTACIALFLATLTLPSGWQLTSAPAAIAHTGTMPQGIALSPDGRSLAVVESGVLPAALRVLNATTLAPQAVIPLPGAFGTPVWLDRTHVLVAGANTDALLDVDVRTHAVAQTPVGKGTWPAAVAAGAHGMVASADDGNASVSVNGTNVRVGDHPADVRFSADGKTLYASVRSTNRVVAIDVATRRIVATISVGLHPGALALSANGTQVYVAQSDDDSVGVIDARRNAKTATIRVGLRHYGASPNALLVHGGDLFVSLGAENAVARVQNGRVVERIPAGWYPTGLAMDAHGTLYVSNGKGEGAPANPQFDPFKHRSPGYVAAITVGSVRAIPRAIYDRAHAQTHATLAAIPHWTPAPASSTVLRAGGPIRHVIYVIKENRTYDQVLGDVPGANGDPKLTTFGARVTPNEHAIARRFGIFDNAYANAQVSADGHNWADAGIANDYVERFWPPNYGGRRDLYDMQDGGAPVVPHSGYLWDAATRAHVTFRDYGEDLFVPPHSAVMIPLNTMPGLVGHYDPRYIGWDLSYTDGARYAEWLREFNAFERSGTLPQLEIVYFPDDHTSGTKPGARTPFAHVASNDWAVGRLVDTVSHSRDWHDTAIFVLEDDAQNGPDHVSDQRSTFYVASPYAKGGVQHAHYSTVSVLHSIELLLGLPPLTIYDANARPLYDAFSTRAVNAKPFVALKPNIDLNQRNTNAAYGAALSAKMDWSQPDAADSRTLNAILAHLGRAP